MAISSNGSSPSDIVYLPEHYKEITDPILKRYSWIGHDFPPIFYKEFLSPHRSNEVVIEGPSGTAIPLKVVDFEDFVRKKKYFPYDFRRRVDFVEMFEKADTKSKFDAPYVVYGYHKGGDIK